MPGMGGGAGGGTLDFLRSNPQFQALRQMVQANPQILQPMLQELGKQNPQLLQLINSNQQEFLRLINEAAPEGMDALAAMAGEGAPGETSEALTEGSVRSSVHLALPRPAVSSVRCRGAIPFAELSRGRAPRPVARTSVLGVADVQQHGAVMYSKWGRNGLHSLVRL